MSKSSPQTRKWKILYVESAINDIQALDGSIKKIIKKAIEEKLGTDPLKYGLPLRRTLKKFFKLRVGDYRIIYQIEQKEVTVLVIKIGHRREVYEE
jgi:mRNA interferase RelE/StbE